MLLLIFVILQANCIFTDNKHNKKRKQWNLLAPFLMSLVHCCGVIL